MSERQRAFLLEIASTKRVYWAGVEEMAFRMFGATTASLTHEQVAQLCNAMALLPSEGEE